MPAATLDITIEQGATFKQNIVYNDPNGSPINLTGYTARMDIKDEIGGTLLLSLSSASEIVLGGSAGTIDITIAATVTAALTKSGVYDLELVNGSEVTRLLQGTMTLSKEVTT